MSLPHLKLFSLNSSREFAKNLSRVLNHPLSPHEEREFEDGEHKARPLTSVRGERVVVVQSLYSDNYQSVNDKLCRLLFFTGALKEAVAARITLLIPYLAYSRKDRQTKNRDPVTTRYTAMLLEAVGAEDVITMDVHNLAAYQNAFRCNTEHLDAKNLFAEYFTEMLRGNSIAVVSPDAGGIKRAHAFSQAMETRLGEPVNHAFLEKYRSMGKVTGETLVGDVKDKAVIILDDLISTGGTLVRAINACQHHGVKQIYAAATHGLFTNGAEELLGHPYLEELVICDTVTPFRVKKSNIKTRLTVLSTAKLFAELIQHMHYSDIRV